MKKLVIALMTILFLILHTYLASALSISYIVPDFVIILLALLAMNCGLLTLTGAALFLGLSMDTAIAGTGFTNTFIYVLIAIGYGIVGYLPYKQNFIKTLISTLAGGLLKYFVLMFALYIQKIETQVSVMVFIAGIPAILYTALLMIPFYFLFKLLYSLDFMQDNNTDKRIFLGG